VDNSVLSDVQVGGLTFITGGDYTHSSVIPGYWALAKSSLFIGHSQTQKSDDPGFNGYAIDAGPFNNFTGLKCDWQTSSKIPSPYCLSKAEGISMPLSNFAVNQRLFNIYDGPAYQDGNAYFDVTKTDCPITGAQTDKPGCMYGSSVALGVRKVPETAKACSESGGAYLPNAAIAWKQPNGFFYPPAFHSDNLFFDNVDIRHYVVNPLFKAPDAVTGDFDFHQGGTYKTDFDLAKTQFCSLNDQMFNGYSGIDRQTELSDDDGSLTGLINDRNPQQGYTGTISINQDPFFAAPTETAECRSSLGISPDKACNAVPVAQQTQTARTSPYDYVAVAVEPECSQTAQPGRDYGRCGDDPGAGFGGYWSSECSNQFCYGIPLFRQLLIGTKGTGVADAAGEWKHWWKNKCNDKASWGEPQCRWPFIRMAGANMYQRETLVAGDGVYYLDTTIPLATQRTESFNNSPPAEDHRDVNLFEKNKTYYVYFLYAKPTIKLTLQIYVGNGFQPAAQNLYEVRGDLATAPVIFTPKPDDANKKLPPWLKLESTPVDANGVLTVSIDFAGVTELLPSAADLCQPRSFCKPDGNACVTALTKDSPAVKANPDVLVQAGKACSRWAMKDLDCPRKGCFGFAFKLPDGFAANGQGQAARPTPISFADAQGKNIWPVTKFLRTTTVPDKSEPNAAYTPYSCYYKDPLPGTPNCSPLDPQ
jgi:cell migration-inducing and hyaluronan-binding protein